MVAAAPAAPVRRSTPLRGLASRTWASPDARPVGFLVVLPVLVFVIPAAIGKPAISFDNLLQNFPLRVLSGQLLSQGHLPLWNPTIWSGSPLLAGLNAGSLYPGTLLFAVLPAIGAWILNLLIVYWAAGLGTYALLRQFSLRPLSCLLAAVTYQFGGAMTGQLVHLGVVQAMAWMPLIALAVLRLSWAALGTGPAPGHGTARPSSPWPWTVLLAVLLGLVFLAGEPRGMAEAEIVVPFLALWFALTPSRRAVGLRPRVRFAAYVLLAGGWGIAIGAVQLLPGHSFITASQRSSSDYLFFGSGSLKIAWTILLLVQNIMGGNEILGQAKFAASYNLPEVTGYVGLLPLAGFFALVVRALGRGGDPRRRDWAPWLLLAPLGLLLAWGTNTPLGHVWAQIPLYNRTRLDSRNLGIVDLGLAVLFGFFVELLLTGDWRVRAGRPIRWLGEVVAPLAAPVAGLAAAVTALAIPGTVMVALVASPTQSGALRPWMAGQVAVALGAVGVVWAWRRRSPAFTRRLLVGVVTADLGLFALSSSTGMFAGAEPEPTRAEAAAVLGTTGRFAIVGAPYLGPISHLSQPDINALTGLDSVQGYGSIVSSTYNSVTGTHYLSSMDPCALARGVFVPLRLSTLLLLPTALLKTVPAPTEPAPGAILPPTPGCAGAAPPGTTTARRFYFGETLSLVSVDLRTTSGVPAPMLGLVSASGATRVPTASVAKSRDGWELRFAEPERAVGLVVLGHARAVHDDTMITTSGGHRYTLNGPFQDALGQTSWRFAGLWESYAKFTTTRLGPRVSVRGAPGATVRLVQEKSTGSEVDVVDTPAPATVVRSEAYLSGWTVRAQPLGGGPTRTLPVSAVGLLQGVRVPAGRWRLTFVYWPSGLTSGGVASALGVVAAGALAVVRPWRRSRRASEPVLTSH